MTSVLIIDDVEFYAMLPHAGRTQSVSVASAETRGNGLLEQRHLGRVRQ